MKHLITLVLVCFVATMAMAAAETFQSGDLSYTITSGTEPYTVEVTKADSYKSLKDVVIPESVENNGKTYSVTSIGQYAFAYCNSLTSVTIPNSVTSIGDEAFKYVGNIVYNGTNDYAARTLNGTIDGDFICADAEKTQLSVYIGKSANVVIPDNVTTIENLAFLNNESVETLVVPASVTVIKDNAIIQCFNTIYCEVSAKPDTWKKNGFNTSAKVIWGAVKNITLTANNDAFGTVEGAGKVGLNTKATLTATAAEGYHFAKWSNGATDATITITVVSDTTLTAEFAANENQGGNNQGDIQGDVKPAVAENAADAISIYAYQNIIVVENADAEIYVFDVMGRLIARENTTTNIAEIPMPNAGIYIVKVGAKAQRVSISL
ncbi:MAG: leucine-rich repeat protein [Salinivirgaceae bacterium]|nr:leucine-rich repeat protein [Salinivirgaceae bacterium]